MELFSVQLVLFYLTLDNDANNRISSLVPTSKMTSDELGAQVCNDRYTYDFEITCYNIIFRTSVKIREPSVSIKRDRDDPSC